MVKAYRELTDGRIRLRPYFETKKAHCSFQSTIVCSHSLRVLVLGICIVEGFECSSEEFRFDSISNE